MTVTGFRAAARCPSADIYELRTGVVDWCGSLDSVAGLALGYPVRMVMEWWVRGGSRKTQLRVAREW